MNKPIFFTSIILITLHSGSMVYCIAAAAGMGSMLIVWPYTGSEDRFNPYNQRILIHECLYHLTK